MAVAQPVLEGFERVGDRDGILEVSNVPVFPPATCYAYCITVADDPPAVIQCGNALGVVGITYIDLNFGAATWDFFGVAVLKPVVVFAVTAQSGEWSEPSATALPQVIDLGAHAIDIKNLRRTTIGQSKISFVIEGLPTETYKIVMLWVNASGDITGEAVTGNGYHVLSADFDPTRPYNFTGIPISPDGIFMDPIPISEDAAARTVVAPVIDRIFTADDERSFTVYWTPPVDVKADYYLLLYRNLSRWSDSWNQVVVNTSPTVVDGLKRGSTYQVVMFASDAAGRLSAPSATIEVYVRG